LIAELDTPSPSPTGVPYQTRRRKPATQRREHEENQELDCKFKSSANCFNNSTFNYNDNNDYSDATKRNIANIGTYGNWSNSFQYIFYLVLRSIFSITGNVKKQGEIKWNTPIIVIVLIVALKENVKNYAHYIGELVNMASFPNNTKN